MEDLAGEVPVVERLAGVDALVALQAHQRQLEAGRERLGQRGLARARLALEEERALHAVGEEDDGGELVVGEVAGRAQAGGHVGGGVHGVRLRPARWSDVGAGPGIDVDARSRGRRTRPASPRARRGSRERRGPRRGLDDAGPVVATEQDRVPRHAVVRRPGEHLGPGAASSTRPTTAASTSGRSTSETSAASWSVWASAPRPARSEAPIPSAQSSARTRATDIGSSAAARSASAPSTTTISRARLQGLHRAQQPRRAVVVAGERLWPAEPLTGARGQQQADHRTHWPNASA